MPSPLAPSKPIPGVTTNPDGSTGSVAAGTYAAPGSLIDQVRKGQRTLDPAKDIPDVLTLGTYTPVTTAVTSVGDFLGKLSNVYLWKRIGIVAIGVLLIWWGILLFLATNKKVQGALVDGAKAVISKTPEGAAANVATGSIGL